MKKFLFLAIIFFLASKVYSEKKLLKWIDLLKMANENNQKILASLYEIKAINSENYIYLSKFFPKIESGFQLKFLKQNSADFAKNYSFDISLNQLLFDGLKTLYDYKKSKKNLEIAKYNYRLISATVRLNLRLAYIEYLRAKNLLKITEEIAKRNEINLEAVKIRYKNGREHKGSLLTMEANLEKIKTELKQIERSVELAKLKILKEIGVDNLNEYEIDDKIDITNINEIMIKEPEYEEIIDNNFELRMKILSKELAELNLKSAKASFFPSIYFNFSWGRNFAENSPVNKNISFGFSISLPLFESGARVAEIYKAKYYLLKFEAEERDKKYELILNAKNYWINYQNSIENIKVQKNFLEAAQTRAKIAFIQYSTGILSFDNWLIIENENINIQNSYLESLINALKAEAYWDYIKGVTLDEI